MSQSQNQDRKKTARLLVVRAGGRRFAIETGSLAHGFNEAWSSLSIPTPLPGAPPAVLGVVHVRGRIYTAIDVATAFSGQHDPVPRDEAAVNNAASQRIVPLRGKEQLAIAVESIEGTLDAEYESSATPAAPAQGVRGVLHDGGGQPILVLEPGELFAAATRDLERRRRRRS